MLTRLPLALREILELGLELANASINLLQIHQRFYDRHLYPRSFCSGLGQETGLEPATHRITIC